MSNTDAIVNTPLTTKQPFLTFLANDNNNSKRQTTMEQITKGFTHFSLSPRNGYKSNKDQAIVLDNENDIHRPSSVASSDSDSENIYNIPSRMPLRVVNPDPEDSEEEENQQQQKPHQESKENGSIKPLNNNTNFIPSDNNVTVPETMAKQNNDKHVTQFISPLSNPIEQQNKSSNSSNDGNENNNPTTTTTTKPSIFRRQSKTLDETSHSNLLPPVDRTPFNSTHFTGTTPYTSQYDLNTTTTDTHRDPTITDTTTTTSNIKKRSSSLPKYNNEPSPLSPPSISNTPFNQQQQQQNILSPIAESTTTQPELLLQSIDSNQVNLTFNQPLFSSSINNDNDSTNRSSIDYLNSPHPSHVGSTNYAKYTTQSSSKYTKASYSLTNNPGSLRLYRDMAKKTRDKSVQFTYACYLLEIADLYDQGRELKHNKLTSIKHSLSEASQRLRQELGQTTTRYSIDSLSSSSLRYQQQPLGFRKDSLPSSPRPSISNSIVGRSSFQSTGVYQIPSIPLSPTATTVDSYIANSTFPIASPSPSSLSSTFHHQQQQPQTYQTFNFESNSNDDKNNNGNSHRRKKRVLEEEGIHWMKKLAKENVPEATFMLASWMDQSLYGFSPNPSKSFALYDVAAKAGNQEAVYRIGLYYESINDYKNAYQCIRQASDMGITQATLKLFKIHLHGELKQRQNMTLAISILYKATLDTDESNPEPFYLFGLILSNTYPHADIPSEVVEQYGGELNCLPYFEKAVQQGYPPAHSALGYILEHGLYGVRVNYAKSYIHYAESSKKGDPRGMVGLSRLNNKGSNGPDDDMDYQLRMNEDESGWLAQREPNEENAFYWCEKAAVQHELDEAEFLLGWYYEIGLGVPRDYAKAQWYYKKAASKGNDHALKRLLLQDNSVSKQQHDFIGSGKKNIVTTTTTTMDGLTPTKTKGKDSQQCYIM
ncbi:hypothetical protein BJ944DRAFT_244572 [Cunninghamella echinulata]|nr:hypothetical protein BJ944DRAFT_244572 [Cunninghamella echinulata]